MVNTKFTRYFKSDLLTTLAIYTLNEVINVMKETIIKYKGQEVSCYGTLKDEDNILMAYTDNLGYANGGIVENYNYETERPFKNWSEAVKYLINLDRFTDIEQLEVC